MKLIEAMKKQKGLQKTRAQSLRRVLFVIKILRHQFPQERR